MLYFRNKVTKTTTSTMKWSKLNNKPSINECLTVPKPVLNRNRSLHKSRLLPKFKIFLTTVPKYNNKKKLSSLSLKICKKKEFNLKNITY